MFEIAQKYIVTKTKSKLRSFIIGTFQKELRSNKLDVIIFGASGFVGRNTTLDAVTILRNYHWAIAGRNKEKLENIRKQVEIKSGEDLSNVPIIVADVTNTISLEEMAQKCKIIVNCCGPYEELGEPVVKACINAGTHYVDISNEPNYMQSMQLKYEEEARKQNVYVVLGCGLQSLPIEIGINFLNEHFKGTINNIEAYTEFWSTDTNLFAPVASKTLWKSAVLAYSRLKDIPIIQRQLYKKSYPDLVPRSGYRWCGRDSVTVKGICLPFPVPDAQIVGQSQYYFFDKQDKRPIQFQHYLVFPNLLVAICWYIWLIMFAIMAQVEYTRNILLRYSELFTFGLVSPVGPNEGRMEKILYRTTLTAIGWSEYSRNPHYQFQTKPNKYAVARTCGQNPFYGVTCACVLTSAMTILEENAKMPERGGVFSPGAAFSNTSILKQLEKQDNGIVFTMCSHIRERS